MWRARQTERGARLQIRGEVDHRELRRQLTDALTTLGVRQADGSIATASAFERQPTGKTKRFIALPD